jgi:hypothetical protein
MATESAPPALPWPGLPPRENAGEGIDMDAEYGYSHASRLISQFTLAR